MPSEPVAPVHGGSGRESRGMRCQAAGAADSSGSSSSTRRRPSSPARLQGCHGRARRFRRACVCQYELPSACRPDRSVTCVVPSSRAAITQSRAMIWSLAPQAWLGVLRYDISYCLTTMFGFHQPCGTVHDLAWSMRQAAERAWTRAISMAPGNAPAYSNRGTARLQAGRCGLPHSQALRSPCLQVQLQVCGNLIMRRLHIG